MSLTRGCFAAFITAVMVLALHSSPALAISQRGHEFSLQFGSFSAPDGLAVDDATGVVYVADRRKKRVHAFEPQMSGGELVGEGEVSSWEEPSIPSPEAIAVDNSGESTDPSSGDVYVVSAGKTLYKLNSEGHEVAKLKGFKLAEAKERKFSEIVGVAVDAHGNLFVYQGDGLIYEFNDQVPNEGVGQQTAPPERSGEHDGRPAFAVDAAGDLYIGDQGEAGAGALQQELLSEVKEGYGEARQGAEEPSFAVVAKLDESTDAILTPALDYEFTSAVAVNQFDEPSNQVNERGDAYLVNVTGAGSERTSTVAEFGPEEGEHEKGTVIQRFTAPGLSAGDAIAVDAKTGAVYVADSAARSDDVDVFELEKPGDPTADGLQAEESSTTPYAQTLSAEIDPSGVSTDYYFEYGTSQCASSSACTQTAPVNVGEGFGDHAASLQLSGLSPATYYYRVVAQNGNGTVYSEEGTFAVIATVSGLPDGRGWELVSPVKTDGAEPEPLTREGGVIQAAADGDAISYVASGPMPAGGAAQGNRDPEYPQILSTRDDTGWNSEDITTPVTEGTGVEVGVPPEYQGFSPNLALALVQPAVGGPESGAIADPPLAPAETRDKTIYLRDDRPLDAEEVAPLAPTESESGAYEAAETNGTEHGGVSPGYVALVTELNPPGGGDSEFGGGLLEGVEFVNANESLSDVVLKSWSDDPGLYEWAGAGKPLKPISVLPGPEGMLDGPKTASLGGPGSFDSRNAISRDGERVIWTASNFASNGGDDLFVRATTTGHEETLQLDSYQGVAPEEQAAHANFQAANASGSRVFFTDTRRLTPDSRATERSPNLYVAELQGGEGTGEPLSATLTDLTPQEDAEVQAFRELGGGVLGVGEGEHGELNVYFVADGALAPGALPGYCTIGSHAVPPGTTCNLFVKHYTGTEWEPTKFIASLSAEDQPDWRNSKGSQDLSEVTSRVAPNGSYLAFMSDRSLTGYDSEDISSESATEPRLDEEVYLYEAASGTITCASCNPSGARPTGVLAQLDAGEGLGLLVSRPQTWEGTGVDHWLAASVPGWTSLSTDTAIYQSRYLSDTGRLFFNSADALVPVAKPTRDEQIGGATEEVGVENVYEYERDGLGGCQSTAGCVGLISSGTSEHESTFLDASESGNDVFFLTGAPLPPEDLEGNHIYDAHVCGEGSAEACHQPATTTPTECEELGGEACQPGAVSSPSFETPASATLAGSGNLLQRVQVLGEKESVKPKPKPLTRAQKLARALKLCRRDKKRAKRLACEKEARKKYGPLKKHKAKKATTGSASVNAR
jgi:sugar lactone lactonase YvrE